MILPVYNNGMRQGVLLLKMKIKTSASIGRKCHRDVAFVRFVVNIRCFIYVIMKQTDEEQYWTSRYQSNFYHV